MNLFLSYKELLFADRYQRLCAVFNAYDQIQIPLLRFDDGKYGQGVNGDDIGIFLFIPKMVKFLGLTIDQGINLFFFNLVFVAIVIGLVGFFKLYKGFVARVCVCVALLAYFIVSKNVPILYALSWYNAFAIIPWYLSLTRKLPSSYSAYVLNFAAGLTIAFFQYLRAFSAVPTLVFVVTILIFSDIKKKATLFFFLIIGLLVPWLYVKYQFNLYEKYAGQYIGDADTSLMQHCSWHNLYMGFGYLKHNNIDDIFYDDGCAIRRAQKFNSEIMDLYHPQHEKIMKQEVINLFKKQLSFVITTIWAKIGVLFFQFLIYANIGALCIWLLNILQAHWNYSFIIALMFSAIPSLATIPGTYFGLSFISWTMLYGMIAFLALLEERKLFEILQSLKHKIMSYFLLS